MLSIGIEGRGQGSRQESMDVVLTAQVATRIIDRVATSLGKRVSLADLSGRIIASSDVGLIGSRPSLAFRALGSGQIEEADEQDPGLSVPLVFDDHVVGALVLHDHPSHEREVIGVVKTLAELLIHHIYVVEQVGQQEQLRSKFISDLVHDRLQPENGHRPREAAIFGIDLDLPRVVVAIGIADVLQQRTVPAAGGSSVPIVARAHRLRRGCAELVRQALKLAESPDTDAWGIVDDRWLALLTVVDPEQPDGERVRITRRVVRFIDELARSSGLAICAGLGRHHEGWRNLRQSFSDATCAADAGTRLFGPNHVYSLRDLGVAAFLTDASSAAKCELAQGLLRPLAGEADLLATVETFLRNDLSPQATASVLTIHRHTLAYRLDKVHRLIGLDPRRFQDAAQISAALLLRRLSVLTSPDDEPADD
jgi:carbohydrate diacid regulator